MKDKHFDWMDYHAEASNDEHNRQSKSAFFRSSKSPHFKGKNILARRLKQSGENTKIPQPFQG